MFLPWKLLPIYFTVLFLSDAYSLIRSFSLRRLKRQLLTTVPRGYLSLSSEVETKFQEASVVGDNSVSVNPPVRDGDLVDGFCRWTNSAFRNLTITPVRDYLEIIPARRNMSFLEILKSPPQYPGISRPVSLTIAASVPTALGWYGFYKFSVEEELFQDEMRREGRVTGCGGYGTLLPFVFLFLIGTAAHFLPGLDSLSSPCIQAGGVWILLGQINLYRRVNELTVEKFGGEPPLHSWWALLPPPLDVIVGLRQVHFLAKYWAAVREETFEQDVFADTLFPFISSERFTLKELFKEPRRWFWFTSEAIDFDI
jgi:hypothetical protein